MVAAKLFDPQSDKPFALSRTKVERQMEFYQWLLRARGHKVARRGWFVYCNGRKDLPAFEARLEFTIRLLPHDGDDGWIEGTLAAIRKALTAAEPPARDADCEYCGYVARAALPPRVEG